MKLGLVFYVLKEDAVKAIWIVEQTADNNERFFIII